MSRSRTLRRRLLPLGALLVSAFAVAPASPAQAAPVSGVNIAPMRAPDNRAEMLNDLEQARSLGAKVVRVELRWDLLEPTRGTWDPAYSARVDEMFAAAKARGIRVVVVFLGTPCWTSTHPQVLASGCASPPENAPFYPPADPAAYGATAAELARRYAPTLAWLEVWNEPDHANQVYWGGADKAKSYAALLKAAYPAIRAAAPSVKVLGGAIVGANGEFLKALYANGAKGRYDALSVHYYDLVLASLRSIRQTQRAAGDTKPLWLGEFGWTSCRPKTSEGGHACVSRSVQAANLRDTFQLLRRASYLTGAVVYALHDTPQYSFGLLEPGEKRKPAFAAVRNAIRGTGRAAKVQLRLRRSGGRVVASGTGPAGDALELNVFQRGRLRYKATFRLSRDRTYRLTLPRALGTRGLQVRVYQYWSGGGVTRRL